MTALTVTACATSDTASQQETKAAQQTKAVVDADASASIKGAAVPEAKAGGQSRVAVVYFSEPEAAQKYDVQGATQYVAQVIQERTGADIFRIERQTAYPADHEALTEQAKAERDQGVHPAIRDTIGDLSRYDTIFLGYPIWWYDAPMPVYSSISTVRFCGCLLTMVSSSWESWAWTDMLRTRPMDAKDVKIDNVFFMIQIVEPVFKKVCFA